MRNKCYRFTFESSPVDGSTLCHNVDGSSLPPLMTWSFIVRCTPTARLRLSEIALSVLRG